MYMCFFFFGPNIHLAIFITWSVAIKCSYTVCIHYAPTMLTEPAPNRLYTIVQLDLSHHFLF